LSISRCGFPCSNWFLILIATVLCPRPSPHVNTLTLIAAVFAQRKWRKGKEWNEKETEIGGNHKWPIIQIQMQHFNWWCPEDNCYHGGEGKRTGQQGVHLICRFGFGFGFGLGFGYITTHHKSKSIAGPASLVRRLSDKIREYEWRTPAENSARRKAHSGPRAWSNCSRRLYNH